MLLIVVFASIPNLLFSNSNFSEERLKQACHNFIKNYCADDVEVSFLNKINPVSFQYEGVSAKISQNFQCQSITKVSIEFYYSGEVIRTVDVPLKIKIFKIVPVTNKTIQSGRKIKSDDFIFTRVDVTNIDLKDIANEDEILDAELGRTISKGSVIKKSMLNSGIVIRKGEKVQVEVSVGSVKIRTFGYSLQDAKAGDIVKFKYENSILNGLAASDGSIILTNNPNITQR